MVWFPDIVTNALVTSCDFSDADRCAGTLLSPVTSDLTVFPHMHLHSEVSLMPFPHFLNGLFVAVLLPS